jgi:hypothetical protein
MARRPLRDPISDLISDMSRAIIGTAANFQDNVSDVTEGITQQVTNTVAAESIPTLTSQIRRTLSGSRTRPSAGTGPLPLNGTASPPLNQTPVAHADTAGQSVVPQSTQPQQSNHHFQQYMDFLINHQRNAGVAGDIDPAGVSQSFSEIADIAIRRGFFDAPDSNPDNDPDFEIQHRDVRVNALRENLANRGYHAEPVPGPNNGIQEYRVSSGGGNRIPPVDPPDPPDQSGVNFTMPEREQETLDEGARRRAEETAAIVESITGCGAGGNRIPPVDPPGPPDPPDDDDPDDENDLFRRFTEWLQRFTGVMPDAREFDTLLNNVTDVLGGQPAQPDDPTRPSPLAGFMTAFSDYFNTPQLSPEAQIRAEQDLTEAVEELTNAVTGNTRTRSGTTPRANRTANWIRRRAQRAVVGTAKVMARMARPLARSFNNLIPQNMRAQMTQWGAQIVGQQAVRLGVPAATAARFGASLGPAAALAGVAVYALPIAGAIVRGISATLSKWSAESLATINRVAKYSPQLTTAQMSIDAARLQRDMNAARRSGPMGAMRVDMQNREEAAWANWEQFKTDTGNVAGTASSAISVGLGKTVNALGVITGAATMAMGYLQQLPIMAELGKKLIEIFGGLGKDGVDPYRESSFGVWMNDQAHGPAAQDQLRRARKPLGPLQ